MIMRRYFSAGGACLLVIALWFQTLAYGYEVGTHSVISENAALKSVNLKNSFANIGLVSQDDELTSDKLNCNGTSTKSVLNWIKEGSICEDDTKTEIYYRYKNHFYDPISTKGLGGILWKSSGIMTGQPAPDWIIDMGPPDQLYSFSQGRQYFYNALTKTTDAERKDNLARMFRTLGDVMHIMQDMAQPQHTRDDSHALPGSYYEKYTDQKRARTSNGLTYWDQALPVPKFATARQYFTDLAQFSNNNFVSSGTNFNNLFNGQVVAGVGYALPVPGPATDVPVDTLSPPASADIRAKCGASTPCVMTFYSTKQTVENTRATTVSIFDQYLKKPITYTEPTTSANYQTDRVFVLNSYTFDSAHPFLIPRATAYSAGILDYFFRGNIDMIADTGNPGKYVIKNMGAEDMTGNFALYYDATDGNRYPVPNAAWSNTTIAAGGQANNLSFAWPSSPAPHTPGEFTLVFSGTMGAELAGYNSLGVSNSAIGAIVAKKVAVTREYATFDLYGYGISLSSDHLTVTVNDIAPFQNLGAIAIAGNTPIVSGKWYWEYTVIEHGWMWTGIRNQSEAPITRNVGDLYFGAYAGDYAIFHSPPYFMSPYEAAPTKMHDGVGSSYGSYVHTGDVLGVKLDMDSGTIEYLLNNNSMGIAFTGLSGGEIYACVGAMQYYEAGAPLSWKRSIITTNFGQSAFTYSVPSGYNAGLFK